MCVKLCNKLHNHFSMANLIPRYPAYNTLNNFPVYASDKS